MSNIQSINISDIDLSLLVRERNDEYVADLQDVLAQGTPLPPVRIANVKEENKHYLIDGHHRTEARKRNSATEIDAIIVEMSKQDARWEAFGANRANGKPLTNAEKRVAIVQMYDEFPSATSRDFATQIGCSHQTAIKVIGEMFDERAREAKRKAREEKRNAALESENRSLNSTPDENTSEEDSEDVSKHVRSQNLTPDVKRYTSQEEDDEEEDVDDDEFESQTPNGDTRVVGADGKKYPRTQQKKAEPMRSFGELAASMPYSYDEQLAAQTLENAVFAMPSSLTLRVHEGRLIITSTDPDKPTLRDFPLQRGTDWQNFPAKAFFRFTPADWDILENSGIRTVGGLATLISADPRERQTLPKFGNKKIENLEKQFEEFWTAHPELCQ